MDCRHVNVLIFGGGAAGLWLLDELRRAGRTAVLLETNCLGTGQTIGSQGILHSGLKYSLQGLLTAAAREAREMPAMWRQCLTGSAYPDLQGTEIRAESFFLWGTDSASSRLGLIGARFGLHVTPRRVRPEDCPQLLQGSQGEVFRVDEQVLSPASLLTALAARNREAIVKVDPATGFRFEQSGGTHTVRLMNPAPDQYRELTLQPDWIVLAAGQGNEGLRKQLGLSAGRMQRRPLHMVLVRGNLPEFYGHCVDGAQTRVSITSARNACGQIVWQVGGQIAEEGVALDRMALIPRAQAELQAVLPNLDLHGTEWSTYRVDRAEGATVTGGRPDSFKLLQEGNVLTAWPTKLVLIPQLSAAIMRLVDSRSELGAALPSELSLWPRPEVASAPWERPQLWLEYRSERTAAA